MRGLILLWNTQFSECNGCQSSIRDDDSCVVKGSLSYFDIQHLPPAIPMLSGTAIVFAVMTAALLRPLALAAYMTSRKLM